MERLIIAFGRRVRALRKAKGMTLEELGRAAGVGYKHLSEVERGSRVPSFEAIERLAKALKVEAYELFLPTHLAAEKPDQDLRLVVRDIERHGSPVLKHFLADVLTAARKTELFSSK